MKYYDDGCGRVDVCTEPGDLEYVLEKHGIYGAWCSDDRCSCCSGWKDIVTETGFIPALVEYLEVHSERALARKTQDELDAVKRVNDELRRANAQLQQKLSDALAGAGQDVLQARFESMFRGMAEAVSFVSQSENRSVE